MIYVISDIHGDYPSFYKMLLKINFSSSDSLCILGDVVDKGSDNLYLLEFIRHMENVCLIKGNHEYLFERYLQGTITASLWDTCGGSATRSEADSLPEEKKRELLAYLKTLPIYKIITVKAPVADSRIAFFSPDWKPLNASDLLEPVSAGWFIREDTDKESMAFQEVTSRLDMDLFEYKLSPDDYTLTQTYTTPQYTDKEIQEKLKPFLKGSPKVYTWTKSYFK